MGETREVSIISHRPVTSSDLRQESSFFRRSVSTFLQLVVAKRGGKGLGKTLASCQCFGRAFLSHYIHSFFPRNKRCNARSGRPE